MRRREFVGLVGAAATWPLAARAQQNGRVRRVGMLLPYSETDPEGPIRIRMFRQRLSELGWVEGRNLRIDVRLAVDATRLQSNARELLALAPDVVMTSTLVPTRAMREATRATPIVFVNVGDPVASGVVSNLARPETNVTDFMQFEISLVGKWLSLLRDMVPRLTRVALLLYRGDNPVGSLWVRAAQEAGERLDLNITAAQVLNSVEIEPAIAAMANDGGLIVLPSAFNTANRAITIALAAKYRVPAIYYVRYYAEEGGLMSYGTDARLQFLDGATYVDRILRGTKPSELPVQFPTKFELVINLKTAKALGLDVSQQLQSIADEVIE